MAYAATSLSSWARAIKETLDGRGIDGLALFAQAGLDPALLEDPNARYPVSATTRLWRLAVEASGDPCLGLAVGGNIRQTTFHALGYSVLASASLKEAFERLLRYFRIVSDAADLSFERRGDEYHYSMDIDVGGEQPADEAVDAFASVIVRMCRALAGPEFAPRGVCLRRPEPADRQPFDKVFRVPVEFAAAKVLIRMDAASVEAPLPAGNPELARHNDQVLARYLAKFDRADVANRVHALLVEQLPDGEPSQDKIASALHMSLRNLQRKLAAGGSSYKAILNETRRDLAKSYIRDSSYSVSEIAFLLGFADTSSFTRAFKRWTGVAPSAYGDTKLR